MLKNLDPILNAELLYTLRSMGHGDSIAIVDSNFPADSLSKDSQLGHPVRLTGLSASRVTEAILSVMPLDTFEEGAARCMKVVGSSDADSTGELPEVQQEVQAAINAAEETRFLLTPVDRFSFYEQAKKAFAIVSTGERRLYGCFILTKGVVLPDA